MLDSKNWRMDQFWAQSTGNFFQLPHKQCNFFKSVIVPLPSSESSARADQKSRYNELGRGWRRVNKALGHCKEAND